MTIMEVQSKMEKNRNADRILGLTGSYSRWQLCVYFVLSFGFAFVTAMMYMSIVFLNDTPEHRCFVPDGLNVNETIPLEYRDGEWKYSQCEMYLNSSIDNATVPCQFGYYYDPASGYESTIVSEWDLVCGKNWLVELSMTIVASASVIGPIVFAPLSDRYGRRKVFLLCIWLACLTFGLQALSTGLIMFTIIGTLNWTFCAGAWRVGPVMVMELFPTEKRTFAGNVFEFFWASGYMLVAPIAYSIRSWRWLILALTSPVLFTIPFYWLVPESIPWLIANGRKKEAKIILQKAAKFDRNDLNEDIILQDDKEKGALISLERELSNNEHDEMKKEKYNTTFMDIIRCKLLLRYTLILCVITFVNAFGFYALNFTVTFHGGDRYLNFFFYAAVEIPAYVLCWLTTHFFGRRSSLVIFHIIGGVVLIATIIENYEISNDLGWLTISLSLIGKLSFTTTYGIIYIITPEVFPTNVRTIGAAICMSASTLAGLIAPYSRILARHITWGPRFISGILSIIAGMLALLLPETRHRKMPDTVEEIENWTKTQKIQINESVDLKTRL